jgi:hypothetical protein
MATRGERSDSDLSRFADRVLIRTRSGTGVAVYKHADGSLGFLSRPEDVAVTRTVNRRVSFTVRCRTCGVAVATCTTAEGIRVSTPCRCGDEREWRDAAERGALVFRLPDIDLDTFSALLLAEVSREEPFVLFGMVRGFVKRYWPVMGAQPDARLWARFFRREC